MDDAADEFDAKLDRARRLLDQEEITALHVGVIREGEEVDTAFAQRTSDSEEGLQALSLLAAHLRLVADEAGVDYATVAGDAATVAERVEESGVDSEELRSSDGQDAKRPGDGETPSESQAAETEGSGDGEAP